MATRRPRISIRDHLAPNFSLEICTVCLRNPKPDRLLVKPQGIGDYGQARGRLAALREAGIGSPIWWYGDYPGHLASDQVPTDAALGADYVAWHAGQLAQQIRLVKADTVVAALEAEFHGRAASPKNTSR